MVAAFIDGQGWIEVRNDGVVEYCPGHVRGTCLCNSHPAYWPREDLSSLPMALAIARVIHQTGEGRLFCSDNELLEHRGLTVIQSAHRLLGGKKSE